MMQFYIERTAGVPSNTEPLVLPVGYHLSLKVGEVDFDMVYVKPTPKVYLPPVIPYKPYTPPPKKETKISTKKDSYPYLTDNPLKNIVRSKKTLRGPTECCPHDTTVNLLKEGCVNCQTVIDPINNETTLHRRVFWLAYEPEPEKSMYFCLKCIHRCEYLNWNLKREDLVKGGAINVPIF